MQSLPALEAAVDPEAVPGSPLKPAVFIEFPERARDSVIDAYAETWKTHGGSYSVLAREAEGAPWKHVLTRRTGQISRLAVTVDLVEAFRQEDDLARSLSELKAGAADLAARLGVKVRGDIDRAEVERRFKEFADLRARSRINVTLQIVPRDARGSFVQRDVHRVARALGFSKGDLSSYAWWNPTNVGYDILATIRPGIEPFCFDFENPDAAVPSLLLSTGLCDVPMPELVFEGVLRAGNVLAKELDGRELLVEEEAGRTFEPGTLRKEIRDSLAALGAAGLLVATNLADESDDPDADDEDGVEEEEPADLAAITSWIGTHRYDEAQRVVHFRVLVTGDRTVEFLEEIENRNLAPASDPFGGSDGGLLYLPIQLGEIRGWKPVYHLYGVPTGSTLDPIAPETLPLVKRWTGHLDGFILAHGGVPESTYGALLASRIQAPLVIYGPTETARIWADLTRRTPTQATPADPEFALACFKVLCKALLTAQRDMP